MAPGAGFKAGDAAVGRAEAAVTAMDRAVEASPMAAPTQALVSADPARDRKRQICWDAKEPGDTAIWIFRNRSPQRIRTSTAVSIWQSSNARRISASHFSIETGTGQLYETNCRGSTRGYAGAAPVGVHPDRPQVNAPIVRPAMKVMASRSPDSGPLLGGPCRFLRGKRHGPAFTNAAI